MGHQFVLRERSLCLTGWLVVKCSTECSFSPDTHALRPSALVSLYPERKKNEDEQLRMPNLMLQFQVHRRRAKGNTEKLPHPHNMI